jgi:polynucleotide 5'-hydroxyl-kinase GRC3/NOL9
MILEQVLEAVLNERVIVVMGDKDTGKTTFVTSLANELFRQGCSVGVIDADVGQSDIGPPTTIGLGIVQRPLTALRDVALQSLYFVGDISPKGHLLPLAIGTRKMLDIALAQGIQKILIDTTGLVRGHLGRVLKQYKIELVAPDVIVCLQQAGECEPLLKSYQGFAKPRILRVAAHHRCRTKTPSERQTNRARLFDSYFTTAQTLRVSLAEVGLFETPLFSGIPLSAQELERLQGELSQAEPFLSAPAPGTTPRKAPAPRLLWGEALDNDLLLVTSPKLRHYELMTLKNLISDVNFIKNSSPEEYHNLLLGVLNKQGECSALGVLRSLDFSAKQAVLFTPASVQEMAALIFSSYKYES